jgi:hypothetical protein
MRAHPKAGEDVPADATPERSDTRAGGDRLQEQPPEEVAEREEHEDDERDGHRRERDEREVRRPVAVQKVAPLVPGGRRRSEMR